jgi:hypothetical protein
MLEKMKAISNPLTIVGLFCGVVEVAGLIVMGTGNLAPEAQRDLIWLVKWFPILLVSLFFVTLNFNSKVLYAPGDFKNEENYLALASASAKQSLGIEKVQAMIATAKTEIISDVAKTVPDKGADVSLELEKLRLEIQGIVQDKLQPVQSFAGALRESSDHSLLSTVAAHTEQREYDTWQLLHDESRPMTLKEIASRLDLTEYGASLILYSLISMGTVKEHPDEGNGITYSAIPLKFEDLNNWRPYFRKSKRSKQSRKRTPTA